MWGGGDPPPDSWLQRATTCPRTGRMSFGLPKGPEGPPRASYNPPLVRLDFPRVPWCPLRPSTQFTGTPSLDFIIKTNCFLTFPGTPNMTKRLPGSNKGPLWASPVPPMNFHGPPRGPQGPPQKTSRVPWGTRGPPELHNFATNESRIAPGSALAFYENGCISLVKPYILRRAASRPICSMCGGPFGAS